MAEAANRTRAREDPRKILLIFWRILAPHHLSCNPCAVGYCFPIGACGMLILLSNMSVIVKRLLGLFHKGRSERDLSDEMENHLALEIQDKLRSGMSPEEARRQALVKLGGMEQAKELYRDRKSIPILETTLRDLGYSLRTLRKSPGFALTAVITLALGVAVNTTIFGMVSPILLRKPPVSNADCVVTVSSINKTSPQALSGVSVPDFIAWRQQVHSLRDLAAATSGDVTLSGGTEPQRVAALNVTANYFQAMDVPAAMGRTFLPGEDEAGHEHTVVLSHKLWQSRFNFDR